MSNRPTSPSLKTTFTRSLVASTAVRSNNGSDVSGASEGVAVRCLPTLPQSTLLTLPSDAIPGVCSETEEASPTVMLNYREPKQSPANPTRGCSGTTTVTVPGSHPPYTAYQIIDGKGEARLYTTSQADSGASQSNNDILLPQLEKADPEPTNTPEEGELARPDQELAKVTPCQTSTTTSYYRSTVTETIRSVTHGDPHATPIPGLKGDFEVVLPDSGAARGVRLPGF